MNEELKEIKEKIEDIVNKYDIEAISIYIDKETMMADNEVVEKKRKVILQIEV